MLKLTMDVILLLQFNTKYYYKIGIGHTARTFWFVTPPPVGPDVPYTFGLIGNNFNQIIAIGTSWSLLRLYYHCF